MGSEHDIHEEEDECYYGGKELVPVKYAERFNKYLKKVESEHLKELCRKHIPYWNDLKNEQIELNIITLCKNKVYLVKSLDNNPKSKRIDKVFLRIINEDRKVMYNIEKQNEVCELLGEYGFGPKIINIFEGGRIEEWIDGFVLDHRSLFNMSFLTSIAILLAKFHKTMTILAPKNWDRAPSLLNKMEEWLPQCREINKELGLKLDMDKMYRYFKEYKEFVEDYLRKRPLPKYSDFSYKDCPSNLNYPERNIENQKKLVNLGSNYGNRVLFCHNDLHLKNLIASYHGITLVDFEFSSFNYVGADIGYLFSTSSLDYDYVENRYLKYGPDEELPYHLKAIFASVYISESLGSNVLPTRRDIIDPFLQSVELFSIGTVLFWALWAIMMKTLPGTSQDFDHVECNTKRLQLFEEKFLEFKNKELL